MNISVSCCWESLCHVIAWENRGGRREKRRRLRASIELVHVKEFCTKSHRTQKSEMDMIGARATEKQNREQGTFYDLNHSSFNEGRENVLEIKVKTLLFGEEQISLQIYLQIQDIYEGYVVIISIVRVR